VVEPPHIRVEGLRCGTAGAGPPHAQGAELAVPHIPHADPPQSLPQLLAGVEARLGPGEPPHVGQNLDAAASQRVEELLGGEAAVANGVKHVPKVYSVY